jgi:hypothetical protein
LFGLSLSFVRVPGAGEEAAARARTKTWPFRAWASARAYTFNFFEMRPRVQTRILKQDGTWSPWIRSQHPLSREQAEGVAQAIQSTRGSFETSKCPFPRHSVVYFDEQEQPVAAVDICFECEDLFAWPDFEMSMEQKSRNKKLWLAFEKAMKGFEHLFGQELGQPIRWQADPQPTPPQSEP